MRQNSEVIISDTSCLILLSKIDEFNLLKSIAKKVYITPAIFDEFGKELPDWIIIKSPLNNQYQKIFEADIDPGEASAIALSLELENSILLIDDLKGRKTADRLKIKYSGTFGLILRAKQEGIISSVKPILEKIRATNFRFSESLYSYIIEMAGE